MRRHLKWRRIFRQNRHCINGVAVASFPSSCRYLNPSTDLAASRGRLMATLHPAAALSGSWCRHSDWPASIRHSSAWTLFPKREATSFPKVTSSLAGYCPAWDCRMILCRTLWFPNPCCPKTCHRIVQRPIPHRPTSVALPGPCRWPLPAVVHSGGAWRRVHRRCDASMTPTPCRSCFFALWSCSIAVPHWQRLLPSRRRLPQRE